MPYRIDGNCVMVQKDGQWQELKCHTTLAQAQAHLSALQTNVEHKSFVLPSVNLWTPITLKSVRGSSDKRLRGTSVRYFDSDTRPDLEGDWFSKRTYLMRNAGYPIKGAPVNIHHGFRERFGNLGIGLIDFTDETELGVEYEAMLFEREQYEKMLEELGRLDDIEVSKQVLRQKSELAVKAVRGLLENVPLQSSGGFDPATWRVDEKTRHIDQAGLIHQAITHMPADSKSAQVTYKSLTDVLKLDSTRKTYIMNSRLTKPAPSTNPLTGFNPTRVHERAQSLTFVSIKGLSLKMTPEEIIALIDERIQAAMAQMQAADMPVAENELAKAEDELTEEVKADVEEELKALDEEEQKSLTLDKLGDIVDNAIVAHLPKVVEKTITSVANRTNKFAGAISTGKSNALKTSDRKSQTSGVQFTSNRNNRQPEKHYNGNDLSPQERRRKETLKAVADVCEIRDTDEPHIGHIVKAIWQNKGMKAQNPYIGTLGGFLVGHEVSPEILDPLRSESIAFSMGVTKTTVSGVQFYHIPKMTTAPTAFRPGINQDITESEAQFDVITGSLRPIAFRVHLPRQMLMTSPDAVKDKIVAEGRRSIDLQIDKEVFIGEGAVTGSNTGAEIKGVLRTLEGITSTDTEHIVTLATDGRDVNFDDVINAETRLAQSNIPDSEAKALAMHPVMRATFRKMTDANGQPLFRGDMSSQAFKDIVGYPAYTSTQLPINITTGTNSNTGYIFFGAWRYAEYLMGDALELIVDEVTLANQLMVRIIGYTYSDLVLHYPEAFYIMKGVNAS